MKYIITMQNPKWHNHLGLLDKKDSDVLSA